MQKVDDTITLEVKSRLNELFGEPSHEADDVAEAGATEAASALKDLKSAVLSIDWEITEKGMNDLVSAVERLKEQYAQNRIVLLFLQLLGSIAKYVRIHKNHSHPEAFRILNTVFSRLEEVIDSPEMEETQKKRYLYAEIVKFKNLKQKIAIERPLGPTPAEAPAQQIAAETDRILVAEPIGEEPPPSNEYTASAGAESLPQTAPKPSDDERQTTAHAADLTLDTLPSVLEEIKELIVREFESLRMELRSLKEQRR